MLTPPAPLQRIDKLPDTSDLRLWTDYVELLCLVNIDREVSKDDVLGRIAEGKDLDVHGDDIGPETGDEPGASGVDLDAARRDDRRARRVDDVFNHLVFRHGMFRDFYPFTLVRNGNTLSARNTSTAKHKLYLFLLLSSNLRYVLRPTREVLTDDFELVSAEVLRRCLPEGSNVPVFGKNPHAPAQYRGLLWDKVNRLAQDLQEQVHIQQTDFKPRDSGDNGLDIVAWVPMGDNRGGYLAVFGQCACTEEWVSKQHSSSAEAWRAVMTLTAPPSNMAFVPFCLRQSNGSWSARHDIHGSILIDRFRFVHFLRQNQGYMALKGQRSYAVIEEVLRQRESVV